jgi:hypothetical protein
MSQIEFVMIHAQDTTMSWGGWRDGLACQPLGGGSWWWCLVVQSFVQESSRAGALQPLHSYVTPLADLSRCTDHVSWRQVVSVVHALVREGGAIRNAKHARKHGACARLPCRRTLDGMARWTTHAQTAGS